MPRERERDYLYRRGDVWWLRLQFPKDMGPDFAGQEVRKSLGTKDREEAEIIAARDIATHRILMLFLKQKRRGNLNVVEKAGPLKPPGMGFTPSGQQYFATAESVHYLNEDGTIERTLPNVSNDVRFEEPLSPDEQTQWNQSWRVFRKGADGRRINDDVLIETWIKQRGISGFLEREARETWALFRTLVTKPLAKCTRDDGRKLVEHLQGIGNKRATIQKKVGHLNAAVNLAVDEGKLTFNPFSRIVPNVEDKEDRLPLSDADLKLCLASLNRLSDQDRLLFELLARTGMRLSEPFEIEEEFEEDGIRFVIVGSKTPQSKRRVPLPDAVLPLLPERIDTPLFTDSAKTAGKRLMRFLRGIGIAHDSTTGAGDRRKVIHGLRHRAISRLRAVSCPRDIRTQIVGHDRKTVHDGYGEGFPVPILKMWVEKIVVKEGC